jgi:acylphosphatase
VKRLYAIVRGRVQGVGFRAATARVARRLGLAGWVRNRMDDSVEITAEGDAAALAKLEEFLRRGPPGARVIAVDLFWEAVSNDLEPFEIR